MGPYAVITEPLIEPAFTLSLSQKSRAGIAEALKGFARFLTFICATDEWSHASSPMHPSMAVKTVLGTQEK